MIFLALVDNANYFSYELHFENDKGSFSKAFNRDLAKESFGDMDLREFAKDEETFLNFVSAINRYYYEGIDTPEEIYALMNMDDAAAQERMNEMLYGKPAAEDVTDRSMTYQMIVAESLAYEIANEQGLASSHPLDYINCAEYEELVKIGEPALREFLASFAEGRAGNGLEAYIMMFACQDILGEPRRADITPAEWYRLYTALDSTYAANFAYDKSIYTPELEKEYSLGIKDVDACSIIRAGDDERIKAVYDAIESKYNAKGIQMGHTVNIYAPYIHKIHESGQNMKVYTTIHEQTYAWSRTKKGYGLFERGGSSIPTRLDFRKENGKWKLMNWVQAKDGSEYADSIKQMCGIYRGVANAMLGHDGNTGMLMWQNIIYYMNAYYGGMDIPVYVSSYTDEATLEKVSKYIRVVPMFE